MKKVLIIDDDQELVTELEEILTEEGFVVEKSYISMQGNKMALEEEYDVILVDYKMPGLSGIELLKGFKKNKVKSAVVVISGSLNIEQLIEQEGLTAYVKAVITKPFEVDDFIKTINGI
jgi:DNA-binding response OmpR family regulator